MMGPLSFPLLICVALAFSQATEASSQTQCRDNEEAFEGFCYSLSEEADTFANARKHCKSLGGDLVSIQTEKENTFVKKLFHKIFRKPSRPAVWIGGYKSPFSPQPRMSDQSKRACSVELGFGWAWTDGQDMTYTNWAQGQPRDFSRKVAMFMLPDGTWGNEYATQAFSFVCEHKKTPTCDEGYSLYKSNCYTFKKEELGFAEAQKTCASEGGNLASVHSHREDKFIRKLTGDVYAWIGGTKDLNTNATYQWTDGTPMDYGLWAEDQPAQNPNNNCILMDYPDKHLFSLSDYGWANELCHIAYGYVCKKPKREA